MVRGKGECIMSLRVLTKIEVQLCVCERERDPSVRLSGFIPCPPPFACIHTTS